MSEITDKLFTEAVQAYCQELPGFPSDTVHADLIGDAVGFRAALSAAFAAGRESAFEGGEVSYDWATRWTESDGYAHITSANSARAGAEQLARKRAKQEMRGVGPGEAVRRVQFVGPWVAVPEEVAR